MYKLTYRSMFRRNSMLRKLLLSIIGMICIPLILIQIYTIQKSTTEFTETQHTLTLSVLQSIDAAFEAQLDALGTAGLKIGGQNEARYPLQADVSEYKLYVAARKIKYYDSVYPLVNSVGIYYLSTDRVMHNGYCYKLSDFVASYYGSDSIGFSALFKFLSESKGQNNFFSTDKYSECNLSQLIIARSLSIGGGVKEDAIAFFTINRSSLEEWCSTFLSQNSGFAIMSPEGEYLLKTGTFAADFVEEENYSHFTTDLFQYVYTLDDEKDTLIYKYQSPDSGYIIFAAMPQNIIHEKLDQYIFQVRVALIFTFVITIVFTAITVYVNYHPIVQLMQRHVTSGLDSATISELDLLDSAFFLRDEQISNQDTLITTFLLSDLLSGDDVDQKELDRYFPADVRMCFVISLTDISISTAQSSMITSLAMEMYGFDLLVTTIPQQKSTIFIIISDSMEVLENHERKLSQIVLRAMGGECGFASGRIVNRIQDLVQSYQDAMQKYYEATQAARIIEAYPREKVLNFGKSIRRKNIDEALEILDDIKNELLGYSTSYQKFLGFDVVHAYVDNTSDERIEELEYMLSTDNIPLMFAALRNAVERLKDTNDTASRSNNNEIKELLLDYVNTNCMDSTFCLTSAADYLKTSIYTASRLFKEASGVNFKEYVTERRLSHACHLLETTKRTVSSIALECGFEKTTYFSTLFKSQYGMTPSEYRSTRRKVY